VRCEVSASWDKDNLVWSGADEGCSRRGRRGEEVGGQECVDEETHRVVQASSANTARRMV